MPHVIWAPDNMPRVPTRHCRRPRFSTSFRPRSILNGDSQNTPHRWKVFLFTSIDYFLMETSLESGPFFIFWPEMKIVVSSSVIQRDATSTNMFSPKKEKKQNGFLRNLLIIVEARATLIISLEHPEFRQTLRTKGKKPNRHPHLQKKIKLLFFQNYDLKMQKHFRLSKYCRKPTFPLLCHQKASKRIERPQRNTSP